MNCASLYTMYQNASQVFFLCLHALLLLFFPLPLLLLLSVTSTVEVVVKEGIYLVVQQPNLLPTGA